MSSATGLIVGSGFDRLGVTVLEEQQVDTPFGNPSSAVMTVEVGGTRALCIARHGAAHSIAPHAVNYRANIWALREAGVARCIAVNAVGTIAAAFVPGQLAVPEQLIDYTHGRENSFGGPGGGVLHAEFGEPFDPVLRGQLAAAVGDCGFSVQGGTYAVTQGPRLETAAEVDRLERDGCAMVGMTAMPEAVLAREAGLDYAICALGVNYAAGRSPGGASIHGQIDMFLTTGMKRAAAALHKLIPLL